MEWSNGGRGALDRLIPLVYDELHRLSARQLKLSASIIHEVAAIHVIHSSAPQMRIKGSRDDLRHRMTISLNYALPEKSGSGFAQVLQGWKIGSIANLQSALPWSVVETVGTTNPHTGPSGWWKQDRRRSINSVE